MSREFTFEGFFHLRKREKKIPKSVPFHCRDAVNHLNVTLWLLNSPKRAERESG